MSTKDAFDGYIKLEDNEERETQPIVADASAEEEKPVLVKLEEENPVLVKLEEGEEDPVLLKLDDDEKAALIKLEANAETQNDVKVKTESESEPAWITSKADKIRDACAAKDVSRLQKLALSEGGLLNDELRQAAWPYLLGDLSDTDDEKPDISWHKLPRHHDEEQVQLDVNRSFVYYPNNKTSKELDRCKQDLSDLIVEVLRRFPFLHYFQGYHDICQVFLLVLPPTLRARAVCRLSLCRIRDFMLPNMGPTIAQLRLIPDILYAADPPLRRHLTGVDPFYALAGTLTMYAHNIERYGDIARLFDALLATPPVFSVYMFVQIILSRRHVLLDIPNDDQAMLHVMLSRVPQPLDLEAIIAGTEKLLRQVPPESLRAYRSLSASSCIKTAGEPGESLDSAARHFKRQESEMAWQDMRTHVAKTMWKYRKPAQAVGAAVAVGLLAVYMRKNPASINYLSSMASKATSYMW